MKDAVLVSTSGTTFTLAWLAQLNEILQLIAFIISITTGAVYLWRLIKGKNEPPNKNG